MNQKKSKEALQLSIKNIKLISIERKHGLKANEIKQWLNEVARIQKRRIKSLSILFVSDEHLLQMNKEFLNHDYYTDIITFDLSESEEIEAELYISTDRVIDNAKHLSIRKSQELKRVIVHGLLHLFGYTDKSKSDQELMRQEEDRALSLYQNLFQVSRENK